MFVLCLSGQTDKPQSRISSPITGQHSMHHSVFSNPLPHCLFSHQVEAAPQHPEQREMVSVAFLSHTFCPDISSGQIPLPQLHVKSPKAGAILLLLRNKEAWHSKSREWHRSGSLPPWNLHVLPHITGAVQLLLSQFIVILLISCSGLKCYVTLLWRCEQMPTLDWCGKA